LIQSFTDKVKGNAARGRQWKYVPPHDPLKEIMKERTPEVYRMFYDENGRRK
jgi:hypothetical protein